MKRIKRTIDPKEKIIPNLDLFLDGTFNIPGFMSAAYSVLNLRLSDRT